MPDLEDWMVTARHEAAHLAAILELGLDFGECWIREVDDQIVGNIIDVDGDPIRTTIAALAGLAQEGINSPHVDIGELIASGCVTDDIAAARRSLARIDEDRVGKLVELFPFALDIVERHAELVDRIAHVLVLVKRVNHAQAIGIAGTLEPAAGATSCRREVWASPRIGAL